jgi:hypothetical protein
MMAIKKRAETCSCKYYYYKKYSLIHHGIDSIKFLHTNKKIFAHREKLQENRSHTSPLIDTYGYGKT